jgi:arginine N-succinyltransferase
MYLLRDAQKSDMKGLKSLAAELNSVNLPNDERALEEIVDRSVKSFSGKVREPLEREYLFVLEEPGRKRLLGTSMIIAQHGTHEAPHIYFDVSIREHYSSTIDRHFKHQVLSIGYNFEGPTEIGGLIVHPRDRRGEQKPGKQLSFVRFLFIAMHRSRFRDTVLAELLPPLLPNGKSLLWEACGKRFTGLTYQEADKISRQNKEFIQQLFPAGDIYASVFPPRVQKLVGQVGPETEGVKRMLEKVGFKYVDRIDPFDGGPHFEAKVRDISLVRNYRRTKVADEPLEGEDVEKLVAATKTRGRNRFRCVRTQARIDSDHVHLPTQARELLEVEAGDTVHLIPFE